MKLGPNFTKKKRIAVAMSGGVDSSVAAYLLKKEGYDVIGFSMQLWPRNTGGGCCGVNAMNDAARVAKELDIPHYVLDVRKEFREKVIDEFYFSYEKGETPNPCIRCNEFIKFDYLLQKAEELDANLASGHYARIEYDEVNDQYRLLKGIDETKDQSYALYRITQEQLSKLTFPVGHYKKDEIREIAREMKIYVANKPDSQDICFQDETNFRELMAEKAPKGVIPGDIVDRDGNVLGQHQGIAFYTVGQRRRLGVQNARPLYVLEINSDKNQLIVGFDEDLKKTELTASSVNLIPKTIDSNGFKADAKIRYLADATEAEISVDEKGKAIVKFYEEKRAITPGQSVVFYHGDEVIGGGIIDKQPEKLLKIG